jgi:hypothetical protein
VTAFALEKVRFASSQSPGAPEETNMWQDAGWVFMGVANGKGRLGTDSPGFGAARARYKEASQRAAQIDRLLKSIAPSKQPPSGAALKDLADLGELRHALSDVRGDKTYEALFVLDTAWQDAFVRAARSVSQAQRRGAVIGNSAPT